MTWGVGLSGSPLSSGLDTWVQGVNVRKVAANSNLDTHRIQANVAPREGMNLTFSSHQLRADELNNLGATEREKHVMWCISATAAFNMLGGDDLMMHSRKPEVMADAAYAILSRPSREFTGQFCIDDAVLEGEGITDLSGYAVNPDVPLAPDFFVEPR